MIHALDWLLVAVLAFSFTRYLRHYFSGNEAEKNFALLVIGILSAQENFDQRSAIRKTWLNSSHFTWEEGMESVRPWFIIGKQTCPVPPACRRNSYDCLKWDLDISGVKGTFHTSQALPHEDRCESQRIFHQGISFQVNHPVIVLRLGVLYRLLPPDLDVLVSILDLQTKETVVNATLSRTQYNNFEDGFVYKNVENFLLPKGYEGLLLVEGYLMETACQKIRWNNNSGIITFSKIFISSDDAESISHSAEIQAAPSIYFAVENIQNLVEIAEKCEKSFSDWEPHTSRLLEKLDAESKKWGDIAFVDVVDVYRHLPRKLLLFYNWVMSSYEFDFLLKTDDDCILDIESIMAELQRKKELDAKNFVIWSRFRSRWPVNYVGKWADHDYRSPVYPMFPCGGGYVLSHKSVFWLHNNSVYLHPYQGEDVSLGIWMSAVNPVYVDDESWECSSGCTVHSYNMVQLTPEEITESWSKKLNCGNLCRCEKDV